MFNHFTYEGGHMLVMDVKRHQEPYVEEIYSAYTREENCRKIKKVVLKKIIFTPLGCVLPIIYRYANASFQSAMLFSVCVNIMK
jgi:hypothetical protein